MPDWPAERRALRITVVGGGPVALLFAALVAAQLGEDEDEDEDEDEVPVRIRIFDGRWRRRGSMVDWKGEPDGNRRRQQVVTIQSRQYTMVPRELFEHVFPSALCEVVWPVGSDSVGGLPPLNIRVSDLEDGLLDWVRAVPQVELVPERFDAREDLDALRGEHLVVVCDGAGSGTREALGVFGRASGDSFERGGRRLEDMVLGLRVRSRLRATEAVLLTVAQNRFLLNPGIGGEGFLNMRLTDEEAEEVGGTAEPFRRPGAHSVLWARIRDGLRLYDVDPAGLTSVTAFRPSMVERSRFSAVLFHRTTTGPATIAALLGDAAIAVHFWPGRGLNTGIGTAASLAHTVLERWNGETFREADLADFESRMSHLQYRNHVRGFYGSMRVDDATRAVTPIRDLIGESFRTGPPSEAQHRENRAILSRRLLAIRENLSGRMPGGTPDVRVVESRIDQVTAETVAALVAGGPWDTYRSGGPEVNLMLSRDGPATRR